MTALTLYHTNAVSPTLTTADKLITAAGGGLTNYNSVIGKATGYGEICSQGTSSAWAASSTMLAPTGLGWLWDDTTLADGSATFPPGTWTATVQLKTNTSSIVANVHVNIYKRSSSGVYTSIIKMSLSGQTIISTETPFTVSGTTTTASPTFQTGDKLYTDVQLNVTTNTVNSTTLLGKINTANSTTAGNTGAQIVTPGYTTITTAQKDALTRFKLSSPTKMRDAVLLFRLSSPIVSVLKNASMRFRANKSKQKDAVLRFLTKSSIQKDATILFRLSSYSHSALFPPAVRRTGLFPNATRRQTV